MDNWLGGRARTLLEQLPAPKEGETFVLVVISPVEEMGGVACELAARRTAPNLPAEVIASVVAAAGPEINELGTFAFVDE